MAISYIVERSPDTRKGVKSWERFTTFNQAKRQLRRELRLIRRTIKRMNRDHAVTVSQSIDALHAFTGEYDSDGL